MRMGGKRGERKEGRGEGVTSHRRKDESDKMVGSKEGEKERRKGK